MRMGWRGIRILSEREFSAVHRGPGDLLLAVRPYLLIGGSLLVLFNVLWVLVLLMDPWSSALNTTDRTHYEVLLWINAATGAVLFLALSTLLFRRMSPASRPAWAIYCILLIAVIATALTITGQRTATYYPVFSNQWWLDMLFMLTRALGSVLLSLQAGVLAVVSRPLQLDGAFTFKDHRSSLAPQRLRIASMAVIGVAVAYSVTGMMHLGWVVKVEGVRSLLWNWQSASFAGSVWIDRAGMFATMIAFVGAVIATAGVLTSRAKLAVISIVVWAISTLVIASGRAIWSCYWINRLPEELANRWFVSIQYTGMACELLACLVANVLSVSLVRRYARSLKESADDVGRAFEPLFANQEVAGEQPSNPR
jgi:hypothetical protein